MQIVQSTSRSTLPLSSTVPEIIWEQGSGVLNEDAYLAEENIFGVFDGASSLCEGCFDGYSGAWWAANLARSSFLAGDTLPLADLARQANENIGSAMDSYGVSRNERLKLWSTSAAVAKVEDGSFEFAQVGDALVLCIRNDGSYFLPTPYVNHDEQTLLLWKALVQNGIRDVRTAVQPYVEKVRLSMNKTYGVMNGEAAMESYLAAGRVSTNDLSHVLLFTDGLHIPNSDPSDKTDFSELVDVFLASGLEGLRDHVRTLEQEDPHCFIYPRFKQHDDIAAIALRF